MPSGIITTYLSFEIWLVRRFIDTIRTNLPQSISAKPSFRVRDLSGVDDAELSNVSSGHTEVRWKMEPGRVRDAARDGSFDVRCPREFQGIGRTCQNFPGGCCGESRRG